MAHALQRPISEDDYLASEALSQVKREFVSGKVYAMAGASANHNRIALNLASICNAYVGACQAFMSDMKLRLDAGQAYYYPDVMLVCDASDNDAYFKTAPCMLTEVLSPGTETLDRREKLLAYQKLPSLREYLLIAQDRMQVEVFHRVNLRQWGLTTLGADDTLTLHCAPVSIAIRDLYRGADFSQPA
jgi:Uma2 family endonuclease